MNVSFLHRNRHISTLWPYLFRTVEFKVTEEFLLKTSKDEIIEMDYFRNNSDKAVIIFHGLESNSKSIQLLGIAQKFYSKDYDVFCPNFIGCGKTKNKSLHTYHASDVGQIKFIIDSILSKNKYSKVGIVGISLGGNMVLNYLSKFDVENLEFSIAISPPLNMSKTVDQIDKSFIYRNYFLKKYRKRITSNKEVYPYFGNQKVFTKEIRTLRDFDNKIHAKAHGFKDAEDYYTKSSSGKILNEIKVPTLIISAKNDPLFTKESFPGIVTNKHLTIDYPKYGGHVGFRLKNKKFYHEERALEFAESFME